MLRRKDGSRRVCLYGWSSQLSADKVDVQGGADERLHHLGVVVAGGDGFRPLLGADAQSAVFAEEVAHLPQYAVGEVERAVIALCRVGEQVYGEGARSA